MPGPSLICPLRLTEGHVSPLPSTGLGAFLISSGKRPSRRPKPKDLNTPLCATPAEWRGSDHLQPDSSKGVPSPLRRGRRRCTVPTSPQIYCKQCSAQPWFICEKMEPAKARHPGKEARVSDGRAPAREKLLCESSCLALICDLHIVHAGKEEHPRARSLRDPPCSTDEAILAPLHSARGVI
jgi:hypothetical protein